MAPDPSDDSITVIVPALDEEARLEPTVREIRRSVEGTFARWEILIFNDGSSDRTGEVADALARSDARIRAFHHASPRCIGAVFKEGLHQARMAYVIVVNGKHDLTAPNLDRIFSLRGKADMVIPFTTNASERSLTRRSLSKAYTFLLNALFGLRLLYYNHSVLHRTESVRTLPLVTDSYAFHAEIIIRALRKEWTFVEVGVEDRFEKGIRTKAFAVRNVLGVAAFLVRLILELRFGMVRSPKPLRDS